MTFSATAQSAADLEAGINTQDDSAPRKGQKAKAPKVAKPKKEKAPKAERGPNKKEAILNLLRTKEGATLEQLMTATGWLKHSVHGQLANLRKTGLAITSEKSTTDATRTYHLAH